MMFRNGVNRMPFLEMHNGFDMEKQRYEISSDALQLENNTIAFTFSTQSS